MTRKEERAELIAAVGATPVVCDVYDYGLTAALADFGPEVVINEITDLPAKMAMFPLKIKGLNRARTKGNDALIAAAKAAGATQFIAQSVAFKSPSIVGGAIEHLEAATLAYPGVVLRYGYFYGLGTWYPDGTKQEPRVQVEYAAKRTVEFLTAESGVCEIVDPA